jgi:hypothetical protein
MAPGEVKSCGFYHRLQRKTGIQYIVMPAFVLQKNKRCYGKGEKISGYLFTLGVIECSTFFSSKGLLSFHRV